MIKESVSLILENSLIYLNIVIIIFGLAVVLIMRHNAHEIQQYTVHPEHSGATWSLFNITSKLTQIFPDSNQNNLTLPTVTSLVGFNDLAFIYSKSRFSKEIVSKAALFVSTRYKRVIPVDHMINLLYTGFNARRISESSPLEAKRTATIFSEFGVPSFLYSMICLFPLGGTLTLKNFGMVSIFPDEAMQHELNTYTFESTFKSLTIVNEWSESTKLSLVKSNILDKPHGFNITSVLNSSDLYTSTSVEGSTEPLFSLSHLFLFLTDIRTDGDLTRFCYYSGIKFSVLWSDSYIKYWIIQNISRISSSNMPPRPRVSSSAQAASKPSGSGGSQTGRSSGPYYNKFEKDEAEKLDKIESDVASYEAKNGPGSFFKLPANQATVKKLRALRAAKKRFTLKKPDES